MTRRAFLLLLVVGVVVAVALAGDARPAAADSADEAPWEGYDPGPSPSDGGGELYHGRGDDAEPFEEEGGCEHRYYSYGTPYWDCHARGCERAQFYFLSEEGHLVSVDTGSSDDNDRQPKGFVVCEDPNGPYTGDDFRVLKQSDDDEEGEGTVEPNEDFDAGKHYIVCTNRPSTWEYGTDWMHCPTYGFRTVPCTETQGFGIAVDVPALGDVQVGDENEGFWEALDSFFGDQAEARIVPDTEGPPSDSGGQWYGAVEQARQRYGNDLSWWYDEIAGESISEGGKACTLAETPPTYRSCAEIVADRDHAQQMIDDPPTYGDERDRGPARDVARTYWDEQVRDLESLGSIIPDTCFGTFPTEAYSLYYDHGGVTDGSDWPSWFMGTLGELALTLLKAAVSAGLWMVRASLTQDVTQYGDMVQELSGRWDVQIVHLGGGHASLMTIAWFAVFATAAIKVLLRKAAQGAGEIAGSMVMATLGSVLMTGAFTSGGYFESSASLVDITSRGMLLAGSGCDANEVLDTGEVEQLVAGRYDCGGGEVNGGLGGVIHREFVETPFRYINWGTDDLDPDCQRAEERLLRLTGMTNSYATRFMERQGCVDEADHSDDMNVGRLISVLIVTAVGLFVSVLLLAVAFTLLVSKFVVAVLFAALPFFVAAAILPGNARRPALWAGENLLKTWIIALILGAVLAAGLVGFQAIADATSDRSMFERQVIITVLLAALWALYKQADRGGQVVAGAAGRGLGQVLSPTGNWASVGAGMPFGAPSGSGMAGPAAWITAAGTGTTAVMSATGLALRTTSAPLRGVGRALKTGHTERRVANRGIKNLVRKDVLSGNLPVGTPSKTAGLRSAVRTLRRQHGRAYVPPKPRPSRPPVSLVHPSRSSPVLAPAGWRRALHLRGARHAAPPGGGGHVPTPGVPIGPPPTPGVPIVPHTGGVGRPVNPVQPNRPAPGGGVGRPVSLVRPNRPDPQKAGWWANYRRTAGTPPAPPPAPPQPTGLFGRRAEENGHSVAEAAVVIPADLSARRDTSPRAGHTPGG